MHVYMRVRMCLCMYICTYVFSNLTISQFWGTQVIKLCLRLYSLLQFQHSRLPIKIFIKKSSFFKMANKLEISVTLFCKL
jgi:hypothetical protein